MARIVPNRSATAGRAIRAMRGPRVGGRILVGRRWQIGESTSVDFGQSFVQARPSATGSLCPTLHLCQPRLFSANGTVLCQPRVQRRESANVAEPWETRLDRTQSPNGAALTAESIRA